MRFLSLPTMRGGRIRNASWTRCRRLISPVLSRLSCLVCIGTTSGSGSLSSFLGLIHTLQFHARLPGANVPTARLRWCVSRATPSECCVPSSGLVMDSCRDCLHHLPDGTDQGTRMARPRTLPASRSCSASTAASSG